MAQRSDGRYRRRMELPALQDASAAALLGAAFAKDPAFTWVFPDESKRTGRLTWIAERLIRMTRLSGGTVDASDDVPSAIALWVPVDAPFTEPLGLLLRAGFGSAPFALGLGALARLARLGGPTNALHRTHAPLPHDYLLQVAVDPSRQGGGIGARLVRAGLERAARNGRAVWLETSNPRNVPFYERLGLTERARYTFASGVTLVGLSTTLPRS